MNKIRERVTLARVLIAPVRERKRERGKELETRDTRTLNPCAIGQRCRESEVNIPSVSKGQLEWVDEFGRRKRH